MKTIYIFICFLLFSAIIHSQKSTTNINLVVSDFDGTYQIEIHNVRYQPNIPGNIVEIVNDNRLENETFYYPLDSNIRILIQSRTEIYSPNFERLEFIKYYK